jgi:hypothetical protein
VLVLYFIAGALILVMVALAIPVDFVFRLNTEGEPVARARVELFFGMAKKEIARKKKKAAAKKRPQEGIVKRARRRVILGLVRRLIKAIRFRRLNGVIRLGLDDPASTGIVYGIAQALISFVSLPPGSDFSLVPDFSGPSFQADVEGRVRVYPLQAAGIMLRYLFSREGWHTVRQLAAAR